MAWRNFQNGRGDRQGAVRLACVVAGLRLLEWILNSDHVLGLREVGLFNMGLSGAILDGASACVLYLALEPYIRRRWPQVLIAWNRALGGATRDPLVGYEILVGVTVAAGAGLLGLATVVVSAGSTATTNLNAMLSVRRVAAFLVDGFGGAMFVAVALAFFMFVLRQLLRRDSLAGAVVVLLFGVAAIGEGAFDQTAWPGIAQGAVFGVGIVIALTRFGLVSLVAYLFTYTFLRDAPTFLRTSAWYSGVSAFALIAMLTIAGWACYVAVRSSLSRMSTTPEVRPV